jgi:TatD DNase family protein
VQFVDTHCHLTDAQFADDLDAVIQRARDAGVTRMVTLGTDVASSRAAIALAEKYAGVYAGVGVHPESVRDADFADLEILRELARHDKVVLVGEIGLDFYWDKTTAPLQQEFLERQLDLAAELNLPVAIHDRDAHEAILQTLTRKKAERSALRGILHAFSGDVTMARRAIALGFYVSVAGPVTFLNAKKLLPIVAALPIEKLLIETDAPYLAPHPLRGKRNEPANLVRVAAKIAEIKSLELAATAAQLTENARRLLERV